MDREAKREAILKKEREMLAKVRIAKKFSIEEQAAKEAADVAAKALEFAKNYVKSA